MRSHKTTALIFDETFKRFHHRKFVSPDPLQFLYNYEDLRDREIVGLIASSLALGRVSSIIDIIKKVLEKIPSPYLNISTRSNDELASLYSGFKYRFYKEEDFINLLLAIKDIIAQYGSLHACFFSAYNQHDETILPALLSFRNALTGTYYLKMIADPSKGSACKRLMLYLRWMIRKDEIDPGGWTGIPVNKLIIPLDTHILKISKMFQLTNRKDGGMKTALQITANLKKIDRNDPIRFDFSLTRPGIHPELGYEEFEKMLSNRED